MKAKDPHHPIDWNDIKRRVDTAARLLDEELAPSPEKRKAILDARAKALAAVREPSTGATFEALEFMLAKERYLIETTWVRKVYPLIDFMPLPGTPNFVLGVIHARDTIISILDLKKFFELPAIGLSDLNKVIVLNDGAMEFGILADLVIGVRQVPHADVQPPLPTLTGIRAEYLIGVTRQSEVVLDGRRLLTDQRIVVLAEVAG